MTLLLPSQNLLFLLLFLLFYHQITPIHSAYLNVSVDEIYTAYVQQSSYKWNDPTLARKIHFKSHHLTEDITKACEKKKQLEPWTSASEEFVHHRSSKTILYIFCHDEESIKRAIQQSICYDWIFPLPLKLHPYCESQVYKYVFPHFLRFWRTHSIEYIVTTTYKYMDVDVVKKQSYNLQQYYHSLQTIHQHQYDFLPLWRGHGHTWYPFAKEYHGKNFTNAWEGILSAMGYKQSQLQVVYQHPPFYKNCYISKTSLLVNLIDFMKYASNVIEHNQTVATLFNKRVHYEGKMPKQQLQAVFQADYYKTYPFILERLPIFYVYTMNQKVCDVETPHCATAVFTEGEE